MRSLATTSETIIVLAGVPKTTLLQRGRPQVFTFNLMNEVSRIWLDVEPDNAIN